MDFLWSHHTEYYLKDNAAEAAVLFIQNFMNDKQVVAGCCGLLNRCEVLADDTQMNVLTTVLTVFATLFEGCCDQSCMCRASSDIVSMR